MAVTPFSPEFALAFKEELNRSQAYRQAGKGWRWTVGLIAEAEPDKSWPEATALYLDLFEGEARDVRSVSPREAAACDFVITAPYSRWKQVILKQLEPTKGMMQGKLKLRGDLPTIVRYTRAAQEMTECTTRIDVRFPDDEG